MAKLELYGTNWCLKSALLRNFLQSQWIDFKDYNVEQDAMAAERVMALYDGKLKFPTLIFEDKHLKNPNIPELTKFLEENSIK